MNVPLKIACTGINRATLIYSMVSRHNKREWHTKEAHYVQINEVNDGEFLFQLPIAGDRDLSSSVSLSEIGHYYPVSHSTVII